MKVIIQKCKRGAVSVIKEDGKELRNSISKGYVILVGIAENDFEMDIPYIVSKTLGIKLFDDPQSNNPWKKSVVDCGYEILLVSQFTLYANLKGTKPDFHLSMANAGASVLFEKLVEAFKKSYNPDKIKTGFFGEEMDLEIVNDGPCTIEIDSRQKDYLPGKAQFDRIGAIKAYKAYCKHWGIKEESETPKIAEKKTEVSSPEVEAKPQ